MRTKFILLLAFAISLSVNAASPTCGLTIITHGFQFNGDYLPPWPRQMAQAITNQIGASLPIYRLRYDKQSDETTADDLIQLMDGAASIDITQSGGAIILLDWAAASDEAFEYPAQNVADKFFDYIFGQTHNGRSLAEIPIHLIGHSRGCSLNTQLALNLAGNGVLVDQVTTLDPHPVRPAAGNDLIPVTYINVLFADNYFQDEDFPEGREVAGAFNQSLGSVLDSNLPFKQHEQVHTYYHGTVNLSRPLAVDDENVDANWYLGTTSPDLIGYNFSRFTNSLLARPASGVNQSISGAGGTGSRVSVDSPQQLWSNAGFDQRSTIPSVVTVGQAVDIPYYFADRNSAQTITFHTDADTNPFNGLRSQIGSVNQNSRPAGSIGTATFQWTPTAADVGTHFIRIKGANASSARYDYYLRAITVQAAATPAPTISSVSPRTFSGTQLITITGTGFLDSSRLTFNDGVNPPYTDRVPATWTPTQLTYNISVGQNLATWTVKVVNGAVESLPYSFYVASGTAQLTSLGVSGPFAIAENGSGQFTATAYFSDGSQQNVTSSATWIENSSATTISSSGLLSAGSVSSDTVVTVTASYTTGGISKSANANVTIANSASCGTQNSDLIVNGGVESGSTGWTLSGALVSNNGGFDRSGSYFIWFGGAVSFSDTGYQTITIPANATSATLSFYYNINSQAGNSVASDTFSATIRNTSGTLLATVVNLSNIHQSSPGSCCYTLVTYNLLAYAGQTIRIHFASSNDATLVTNFRVDDVSVNVSVPNPVEPVLFGITGPTNVAEGNSAQFSAIVVNCDGSIQSVTPSWSENSSATSISSSGLLTAGSVNSDTSVTVTATYGSFPPVNRSITVVNSAASFSYIAISGPSLIDENSTGQFTASAIFSDGSSQSVAPSWSEDSTATTISGGGLLTAGEVNDDKIVTVSASHTIGGVTRTADQEVLLNNSLPPTLTSLTINGPGSVIEYGVASFTATAGFSDGTVNFINGPTWTENSSATSISIFGLLSAGGVTNDTLVTVSFSYTLGAVTLNASKSILVLDGGAPPEMPFEAKAYASVSTSVPSVVAAAQNGGLVLFGNFTGTITVGGQQLTANGAASDFFAVKLNSSNQVVWVRQFGGTNEEVLNDAAPHPNGGWVISGNFRNAGLIGNVTLNSSGNRDAFVAHVDENGNVLWANRCGGTGIDIGQKALADSFGNCFLLGDFRSTASFGNGAVNFTAPGSLADVFIAKYDAAGTFLWARALSGPQADTVRCAAGDSTGSIYLGGTFEQQITVGSQTFTVQGNQADTDGFLAKFTPNGDFVWAKQLGEPTGGSSGEYLNFVTVTSNGVCFFGGSYDGPITLDGRTLPLQTATTAFAGKVSNAGATEWLQALPAEGTRRLDELIVGSPLSDQSLIVGGRFFGTLPVGSTTLTNTSPSGTPNQNLFWAKLNPAGTPQWGISAAGDHSGDIYLIAQLTGNMFRSVLRFDVSGSLPGLGVLTPGSYFVVDFGPQAIPAPLLHLSHQANQLILSWPTNATGFQLESTPTLLPNSWTTDSSTPINIGSNYMVTNVISTPAKFFRLKK